MKELTVNKPIDFTTYPSNRVCAIINTDMDARSALDGLLGAGVSEKDIDIFHGAEGIKTHGSDSEPEGLGERIARLLRSYGDIDARQLKIYESAMQDGGFVFEVLAHTDVEKEFIEQILARHGAHEINYFGTWYIEAMHEA